MRLFFLVFIFPVFLLSCASSQKKLSEAERAELFLQVANSALIEQEWNTALYHLKEAEKLAPKMPDIHHSLALAYFARKENELALRSAQKAIELAPEYSDANNTLGKILMDRSRLTEALPYLEKASKDLLYVDQWKAFTNLGLAYKNLGRLSEAETSFQKAIETRSDLACVAHYELGLMLRKKSNQNALESLKKSVLGNCASFEEAHLEFGRILLENGNRLEAKKKFLEIERLFPRSEVAYRARQVLKGMEPNQKEENQWSNH